MYSWIFWSGITLTAMTMGYSVFAWLAVTLRREPVSADAAPAAAPADAPAVTLFKPLCGAEPETYECLRSFCNQDYPEFQIVFGIADHNDPVLPIVRRLQEEFPQLNLQVVIDRRLHGNSRKVSNLINMTSLAQHDIFVISDSDVRVEPDYLARVVPPLLDPGVGIVTCPYRGVPRGGLWSVVGSQFINDWFMPSVRVAALGGSRSFAFGATIAIHRRVLSRIGGFMAIADQLADDYRLGEMTRRLGLRTVLSDVVVDTSVVEADVGALVRHELRWLRTIRAVRPWGYCLSLVTFGVPVALFGVVLTGGARAALLMLAATAGARILLHLRTRLPGSPSQEMLLLPARDLLSVGLWTWSFVGRHVHWREDRYRVNRDGSVLPVVRA